MLQRALYGINIIIVCLKQTSDLCNMSNVFPFVNMFVCVCVRYFIPTSPSYMLAVIFCFTNKIHNQNQYLSILIILQKLSLITWNNQRRKFLTTSCYMVRLLSASSRHSTKNVSQEIECFLSPYIPQRDCIHHHHVLIIVIIMKPHHHTSSYKWRKKRKKNQFLNLSDASWNRVDADTGKWMVNPCSMCYLSFSLITICYRHSAIYT